MLFNYATLGLLPLALAAPAPVYRRGDGTDIPGKFMVVLKPGSAKPAGIMSDLAGGSVSGVVQDRTYDVGQFKGFAATLTAKQVAALRTDPKVAYLEADGIAHTQVTHSTRATVADKSAPWGLGRISHRQKGISAYNYDTSSGAGTCSYIIDTGIQVSHPEFQGRATMVKSYTSVNTDDNGHGTHVAGTIGSQSFGVAKLTKLYAVKVLDAGGSGAWSDIVAGIDTVVSDSRNRSCPNGVVVNMSLGGGKQRTVNSAVAAAVDQGLFFGVAAGNDGADFSNTSPASEPKAFAVGASDISDNFASFSNYGKTLGAIAPGVDINSTWMGSSTNVISGTSMATPHIVGLGAYLLGLKGKMSPASLRTEIQKYSTSGAISFSASVARTGTPNYLAYNEIS